MRRRAVMPPKFITALALLAVGCRGAGPRASLSHPGSHTLPPALLVLKPESSAAKAPPPLVTVPLEIVDYGPVGPLGKDSVLHVRFNRPAVAVSARPVAAPEVAVTVDGKPG